jgi:hypothetical protein
MFLICLYTRNIYFRRRWKVKLISVFSCVIFKKKLVFSNRPPQQLYALYSPRFLWEPIYESTPHGGDLRPGGGGPHIWVGGEVGWGGGVEHPTEIN